MGVPATLPRHALKEREEQGGEEGKERKAGMEDPLSAPLLLSSL
jgi:hypothetical protein